MGVQMQRVTMRNKVMSCERCEKEYVEHCRTGWFVVTNAQHGRVGQPFSLPHNRISGYRQILPSIAQGPGAFLKRVAKRPVVLVPRLHLIRICSNT